MSEEGTGPSEPEFVDLPEGLRIAIRPIRSSDKELISRLFGRMSPETRYRRFFAPLQRLTGLQATREIKTLAPDVDVLILSMHDDERYLFEALRAGASGYVLKSEADHDLVDAIRAVMRGEPFLTNSAQRSLVREWMTDASAGPTEPLTPREQEVLKLIAEAHTNREIGEILHLSEKTVESHRGNLLRKLGMRDRVELVRYAIRRGLIEP